LLQITHRNHFTITVNANFYASLMKIRHRNLSKQWQRLRL